MILGLSRLVWLTQADSDSPQGLNPRSFVCQACAPTLSHSQPAAGLNLAVPGTSPTLAALNTRGSCSFRIRVLDPRFKSHVYCKRLKFRAAKPIPEKAMLSSGNANYYFLSLGVATKMAL